MKNNTSILVYIGGVFLFYDADKRQRKILALSYFSGDLNVTQSTVAVQYREIASRIFPRQKSTVKCHFIIINSNGTFKEEVKTGY